MAAKRHERNFIKSAIRRPGALTRKAKAAGMSIKEFARKEQHASGTTGNEARFYNNVLSKVGRGKKRRGSRKAGRSEGRR